MIKKKHIEKNYHEVLCMECESGKVMKTKMAMEAIIGKGNAMKLMGFFLKRREK